METRAPPKTKSKRTWRWRRLVQVRLRTFFVLTLAASLGCIWFIQPEKRDRDLAGGRLKVRAQGKLVEKEVQKQVSFNGPIKTSLVPTWVEHGLWELRNREGILLCRGHNRDEVPSGNWTWYYPGGYRAATGRVENGLPSGKWTSWHWNGRKESEITFVVREAPPSEIPYAVFGGGLGPGLMPATSNKRAYREGPATWWWENGAVRTQGEFAGNFRTGHWTEFSPAGGTLAEGEYVEGVREGAWTFHAPGGAAPRVVQYRGGVPTSPTEELSALVADLASGTFRRQLAATRRLSQLGEAAAPTFIAELKASDPRRRLLALEGLVWLGPAAQSATPALEPLAASNNADERRLALVALARANPECSEKMAGDLWSEWELACATADDSTSVGRAIIWLGEPTLTALRERFESNLDADAKTKTTAAAVTLLEHLSLWDEASRPPSALRLEQMSGVLFRAQPELPPAARESIEQYRANPPHPLLSTPGLNSLIPVVGQTTPGGSSGIGFAGF